MWSSGWKSESERVSDERRAGEVEEEEEEEEIRGKQTKGEELESKGKELFFHTRSLFPLELRFDWRRGEDHQEAGRGRITITTTTRKRLAAPHSSPMERERKRHVVAALCAFIRRRDASLAYGAARLVALLDCGRNATRRILYSYVYVFQKGTLISLQL